MHSQSKTGLKSVSVTKKSTAVKIDRWKFLKRDWQLYLFLLPGIAFTFLFSYVPMYGVLYAFQDFNPALGFISSPWVGFKHFQSFMSSHYFGLLMKNTITIGVVSFVVQFPLPIILALLLNELKNKYFKKIVQTVSYFPHFVSNVVVVGMLVQFTTPSDGIINQAIKLLGGTPINFMIEEAWFLPLYNFVGIWQNWGWSSIIYLSALSAIDPEQYEAATVDGASRIKQMIYISIPGITPTIVVMMILGIGGLFSVSFERVLLMQNDLNFMASEVINTYVYRQGLQKAQYSLSTAAGLFQTAINAVLVIMANSISRKVAGTSLW